MRTVPEIGNALSGFMSDETVALEQGQHPYAVTQLFTRGIIQLGVGLDAQVAQIVEDFDEISGSGVIALLLQNCWNGL